MKLVKWPITMLSLRTCTLAQYYSSIPSMSGIVSNAIVFCYVRLEIPRYHVFLVLHAVELELML